MIQPDTKCPFCDSVERVKFAGQVYCGSCASDQFMMTDRQRKLAAERARERPRYGTRRGAARVHSGRGFVGDD